MRPSSSSSSNFFDQIPLPASPASSKRFPPKRKKSPTHFVSFSNKKPKKRKATTFFPSKFTKSKPKTEKCRHTKVTYFYLPDGSRRQRYHYRIVKTCKQTSPPPTKVLFPAVRRPQQQPQQQPQQRRRGVLRRPPPPRVPTPPISARDIGAAFGSGNQRRRQRRKRVEQALRRAGMTVTILTLLKSFLV